MPKEIKLENSCKVVIVDDAHFEMLSQIKWYLCGEGAIQTWRRNNAGRSIWTSMSNYIKQDFKSLFDHKDRNFLNNQDSNLRIATHQQNCFNTTKRVGCKSRYKGVYWHRQRQKWCARIQHNGVVRSLGLFKNEWDAAQIYNFMAEILFKDFAVFNET